MFPAKRDRLLYFAVITITGFIVVLFINGQRSSLSSSDLTKSVVNKEVIEVSNRTPITFVVADGVGERASVCRGIFSPSAPIADWATTCANIARCGRCSETTLELDPPG